MERRRFLQALAGATLLASVPSSRGEKRMAEANVSLVKTADRSAGVATAVGLIGWPEVEAKSVVVKPNFNSSDPFPGSTHNDTLLALVQGIRSRGAVQVIVADRSGMGVTRQVMEQKGIFGLDKKAGFEVLPLEELGQDGWRQADLPGSHWRRGVLYPRILDQADVLIQTCCLKTHRFGGHFTLSLKNSVGMVAKYSPADGYNYMRELHSSPYQRVMIAELNQLYRPSLIVMDGLEAFVRGGPEQGKRARPGVIMAAKDRVALDAVGVAILRLFGASRVVSQGRIFDQEQIRRAAQLKLGVSQASQIKLVTSDKESERFAQAVREVLAKG
jgi:uncharacterized protein (DUF362 family)